MLNGFVPTAGTKEWIELLRHELDLQTIRLYEPWFYNGTINGGDVEELEKITLITVRSAGYSYIDLDTIYSMINPNSAHKFSRIISL